MGICSTEEKPRKIGNENKIENDNIKESKNTTNNNIENSQKETLSKEINNNKSSIKKNINKSGIKEDEVDEKENEQNIDENQNINLPTVPVIGTPGNSLKDKEKEKSFNYDFGNKNQKENQSNLPLEEEQINNINNSTNENIINNYEKFNDLEEFYLICPDCNLYITKFESVEYDENNKDFKIKFKCSCENSNEKYNEKYLYSIIRGEKPKCKEHDNEIIFICEDCVKQICEKCKINEHNTHKIKNLINKEIISDSINNRFLEHKNDFKGFNAYSKLFEFYNISNLINKDSENQNQN